MCTTFFICSFISFYSSYRSLWYVLQITLLHTLPQKPLRVFFILADTHPTPEGAQAKQIRLVILALTPLLLLAKSDHSRYLRLVTGIIKSYSFRVFHIQCPIISQVSRICISNCIKLYHSSLLPG